MSRVGLIAASAVPVLAGVLLSCATLSPPSYAPTINDFSDHVLEPFVRVKAEDLIQQLKAATLPGAQDLAAQIILKIPIFNKLHGLAQEQREAQLEAVRPALRHELLTIYRRRSVPIPGGFAVCIDGKERRYQAFFNAVIRNHDRDRDRRRRVDPSSSRYVPEVRSRELSAPGPTGPNSDRAERSLLPRLVGARG